MGPGMFDGVQSTLITLAVVIAVIAAAIGFALGRWIF
jgi:hypothetical protein